MVLWSGGFRHFSLRTYSWGGHLSGRNTGVVRIVCGSLVFVQRGRHRGPGGERDRAREGGEDLEGTREGDRPGETPSPRGGREGQT